MSFKMHRVHVWSGEVADEPGGIALKLAELATSGANLEYVYTQRLLDKHGRGFVYVAPINGAEEMKAAKDIGLTETQDPIVMRIEGDNDAGLAFRLTQEWAKAGINLHGTTLSVLGSRFVGYVTFDTVQDANRAATILAELGMAAAQEARANGNHANGRKPAMAGH